jgi:hypothetical protein
MHAIQQLRNESGAPRRFLPPARYARLRFLSAVTVAILSFVALARADPALEYKVKAGFLFNFIRFVEWPARSFSETNSPVVIGVLSDDSAAPVLQQALAGKSVDNRPLEVRLIAEAGEARACHILFLGRDRKHQAGEILERLKGAAVLTVSEIEQFCQRGGMLNFVRQDESFRFEINLESAKRADLKISSRLSSMATIIKDTK